MNKKKYMIPETTVAAVRVENVMLEGSFKTLNNNAGLNYGGGGNGAARGKERGGVDDDGDLW